MIPVVLIDEKELKDTFLIYPFAVSITKNWSSENSLTGITDVILSPSDNDNICLQSKKDNEWDDLTWYKFNINKKT